MSATELNPNVADPETRERKIVFLLCLLAAVHVFIFSATFPFFNNVDEADHFDLVVQYSTGTIPHLMETNSPEAFSYIILFATVEYLWPEETRPPAWTLPMEQVAPMLLDRKERWNTGKNPEAAQPPLYYTLAGLWWRSAKALGFHDGFLLYSLRFLNVVFAATLVWLGYFTARLIFPENIFVRLGVPALLAFIPQTVFYSIQNDVLSPLCFGAAFLGFVKCFRAENPGVRLGVFTGLMLAAAFLTKLSNLPLLAVSAAAILLKTARLAKAGKLHAALPSLAALTLCAGLPMAGWIAWCKYNFGDFTGNETKIQMLGWTHKPFAEWWHHAVFTPHGSWVFVSDLIAKFWQGEIAWHHLPLAMPWANLTYVVATIVLMALALLNILPYSKGATAPQRQVLWFGFWCFAAAVAFLGFLSLGYDFNNCVYPSRQYPFFTSGRLMLGALIPFLLLFVFGLDRILKKTSNAAKFSVLAAFILFMLVTEITITWPIFSNRYNWFHM